MKKNIILWVLIGLIAVLGITTIVMSLVNVNTGIQITKPNKIYYYTSDSSYNFTELTLGKNTTEIEKITELFNNSFNKKFLTAWLTGTLNTKGEVKKEVSSSTSKQAKSSETGKIYFVLEYDESLKLEYINDEDKQKEFEYNFLSFEIDPSEETTTIAVYAAVTFTKNGGSVADRIKNFCEYTVSGNFSELYSYVNKLETSK